ncbi:Transcription initiation factor TFIID subunit 9 [Tetrabaena socialis]|uniref:Transcription initiation factor TFIID subunit 9 n=1 Tax=Tetrabaena socialis TaxID=47790 RepID=A0A2J8AFP6_9CHLO|nr:Transcription initiation factor TFIID subunit 9 [Tetrabaena socialis]|eukprot:PNH11326.1 Transcription initiation factor TFIID subunit 9 [Tetrabaena socialis]
MDAARAAGAAGEASQPQDVATMHQLLRSMGVDEFEPRVVNQLMDFMYKYATDVLLDAEVFSEHMGRGAGHVDLNGVSLAIQSRAAGFAQPPPQERVAELARLYNDVPLPDINLKPGLPLPADAKQLTAPNWQYDPNQQYQQQR